MDFVVPNIIEAENLRSVIKGKKKRNVSMGNYNNSRNTSGRLHKFSSIAKAGRNQNGNHTSETIVIPEQTPPPTAKGKINFKK